jgi:ThiD2 family
MHEKKVLRVIDANFNRAKEGLRVAEDTLRFVFEEDLLRKKLRKCRHDLNQIAALKILKEAINERNATNDIGSCLDKLEIKRTDTKDILYANIQRVKESLRVLEEFFKLVAKNNVSKIKKIRYRIYTLEKIILNKFPPKITKK